MSSGIYKITNKVSDHIYIGSAINIQHRWTSHIKELNEQKHCNHHLQNAWNKYGSECFEFSIIEQCFPFVLVIREQFYIDTLKPEYNIAPRAGSQLGYKHTPETRAKIGIKSKGNKNSLGRIASPETRAKQRALKLGGHLTQEHRDKISASHMGRPSPTLGKKWSDEARAKLSATLKIVLNTPEQRAHNSARNMGNKRALGNILSEERKAEISAFMKILKKNISPETRKKMSEASLLREAKKRLKKTE